MRIVDLTQPLDEDIPIYPGDPGVRSEPLIRFEEAGYNVHQLCCGSHAGTHIDAPLHTVEKGWSVDRFPVSYFFFRAAVLDLRHKGPREPVTLEEIKRFAPTLRGVELPLLYFGMDIHWRDPERFYAHPYLSGGAARYLVAQGVRGVATDALSIDQTGGDDLSAHEAFLGAGLIIGENLAHLGSITVPDPLVLLLPLKWRGADAAPVRAVAIEGTFPRTR